jgi:hypothetical protein
LIFSSSSILPSFLPPFPPLFLPSSTATTIILSFSLAYFYFDLVEGERPLIAAPQTVMNVASGKK